MKSCIACAKWVIDMETGHAVCTKSGVSPDPDNCPDAVIIPSLDMKKYKDSHVIWEEELKKRNK